MQNQEIRNLSIRQFSNGIYMGHIKNDKIRDGLGVFIWDDSKYVFGEWLDNNLNGDAIVFFPQGGYLRGNFNSNKANGSGIIQFPSGDIYQAQFKKGILHGQCYKYFLSKNEWILCQYYEGEQIKSEFEQKVEYIESFKELSSLNQLQQKYGLNSSSQYQFKILQYPDGGLYIGFTSQGLPNGLGLLQYSDRKFDAGFYKNGLLHCSGRLNFLNGNLYDGVLKDGKCEGKGVFYDSTQDQWIYGQFQNNSCLNVIKQGDGHPKEFIEDLKKKQRYSSQYFINNICDSNVFEIPKSKKIMVPNSPNKLQLNSMNHEILKKYGLGLEKIEEQNDDLKGSLYNNKNMEENSFFQQYLQNSQLQNSQMFK